MHSRLRSITLLAALAALSTGGVAHGATLIGSDLSGVPQTVLGGDVTGAQLVPFGDAPNPLAAPFDGVLVRIQQRYALAEAARPATLGFRIVSGANPFTARPATPDGFELRTRLAPTTDGYVDYRPLDRTGRPIGIAIRRGEQLGVAAEQGGLTDFARLAAASPSGTVATGPGQHLTGLLGYTEIFGTNNELLLQGVIEPDADGDLRGDDTQDDCPTVKNDPQTGLCPANIPGPTVVVRVPVAGPTVNVPVPGPAVSVPGPTVTVEQRRCRVPLVRGLTKRFASRVLAAAGCRLGKAKSQKVRRGKAGLVIKQSQRRDATLALGAKVDVTLAKRAAAKATR